MNTTAKRPTENLAIGNVHARVLAGIDRLWQLLAHAVRRQDHAGAHLLRHAIARVQAGNQVGAL